MPEWGSLIASGRPTSSRRRAGVLPARHLPDLAVAEPDRRSARGVPDPRWWSDWRGPTARQRSSRSRISARVSRLAGAGSAARQGEPEHRLSQRPARGRPAPASRRTALAVAGPLPDNARGRWLDPPEGRGRARSRSGAQLARGRALAFIFQNPTTYQSAATVAHRSSIKTRSRQSCRRPRAARVVEA